MKLENFSFDKKSKLKMLGGAIVTAVATVMLSHGAEKTQLPVSPDSESDTKKIAQIQETAATPVAQDTIHMDADGQMVADSGRHELVSRGSKSDSESVVQSVANTVTESVVAETHPQAEVAVSSHQIKPEVAVESVPVNKIEMPIQKFENHFRNVLDSLVQKNAVLKDFHIVGQGGLLKVTAKLTAMKFFKLEFSGDLVSHSDGLAMGKCDVVASSDMLKKKAETMLNSKFASVLEMVKKQIEGDYKKTHPKGVDKILAQGGNVEIVFKE